MKKTVAFLLCLMIVVSLCSCRQTTSDCPPEETVSTNDTTDPSVEGNLTNDDQKEEEAVAPDDTALLNNIATLLYEAATRDLVSVFDERLGEVKLKDCRFSSDSARLEECKLLKKAILDIDGDGIKDYVIQSPDQEYIILRYYNGKLYSYCLNDCDYYQFNTDGTVYWCNSSDSLARTCGLSEFTFEGGALNVKSVYSLKVSDNPIGYEYYVGDEVVTGDAHGSFVSQIKWKEKMKFSQFEFACPYPISAEQAWNLANAYWDQQDGCSEGSAGTIWRAKIVLIDTPSAETNHYRFAFQIEAYSGGGLEGYECMPPHSIKEHDQILVNAFTGEITTPACEAGNKCISVEEAIEIVENHCKDADLDNGKNAYRGELDVSEPAPDHIYVIVIQKIVDNYYAYDMEYWIDKYTGEIVTPYYMYGKG